MKKKAIAAVAASTLLLGVYIGTGLSGIPSSVKNDLSLRAKNFVRRLNRRDYKACIAAFDEAMKNSTDEDTLARTFGPALDVLGGFVRFRVVNFSRTEKAEPGSVLCFVRCEYENGPAVFSILFNSRSEISGLHLK